MRPLCLGVAVLLSGSLAFAQQSLTITASQPISLQPDQAVFSINVTTDLNSDLNDVLSLLNGLGVSAANLVYVYSYTAQQNQTVQWTFSLPVSISKVQDTVAALTAAQQKLPKNSTTSISFGGQGTQVSSQLRASQQCSSADLISDARAQAQQIVDALGATVGPILAMSDGISGGAVEERITLAIPGVNPFGSVPINCAVVVQFSTVP